MMVQEENSADEARKAPALERTRHSLPSVTRHGECGRDWHSAHLKGVCDSAAIVFKAWEQKYVGKLFKKKKINDKNPNSRDSKILSFNIYTQPSKWNSFQYVQESKSRDFTSPQPSSRVAGNGF